MEPIRCPKCETDKPRQFHKEPSGDGWVVDCSNVACKHRWRIDGKGNRVNGD